MKFIQSFFLGILAALGALLLEILLLNVSQPLTLPGNSYFLSELFSFNFIFFAAIVIEESVRYAVIYKAIARISKDGNIFLNSVFFGLGFSSLEAILVYWNYQNGIAFDLLGIAGIITIHVSASVLIGYFVGRNAGKGFLITVPGFIAALIIHSLYNIFNIAGNSYQNYLIGGLIIFLLILIFVLSIKSKKAENMEEI
jgi:hypothetical protein